MLKSFAKNWLPPAMARWIRRVLLRRVGIRFKGEFTSWEEAVAKSSGFDEEHILDRVLDATRKVKRGEAAFERDSVLFDDIQYSWPLLAGLMWAAARNGGVLNVLDFGGALGSSYYQNRKFLCSLKSVRWNVVEQTHFVEAGRACMQDDHLRFHLTVEECLESNVPNVVLLSGVLQYIPDPKDLLKKLLAAGCNTFILDRTCYVNDGGKERIRIQHVPASIYPASYPCRFLVEEDVLGTFAAAGYTMVERFAALDNLDPSATWKGHIFLRQSRV